MHDKSVLLWLSGKILKKENKTNKTPEANKQIPTGFIYKRKGVCQLWQNSSARKICIFLMQVNFQSFYLLFYNCISLDKTCCYVDSLVTKTPVDFALTSRTIPFVFLKPSSFLPTLITSNISRCFLYSAAQALQWPQKCGSWLYSLKRSAVHSFYRLYI